MKTTLNINDDLVASAKAMAAMQRSSLTKLIEEGLRLRLAAGDIKTQTYSSNLPIFDGRLGLCSGINPSSNRSMLDAAES